MVHGCCGQEDLGSEMMVSKPIQSHKRHNSKQSFQEHAANDPQLDRYGDLHAEICIKTNSQNIHHLYLGWRLHKW